VTWWLSISVHEIISGRCCCNWRSLSGDILATSRKILQVKHAITPETQFTVFILQHQIMIRADIVQTFQSTSCIKNPSYLRGHQGNPCNISHFTLTLVLHYLTTDDGIWHHEPVINSRRRIKQDYLKTTFSDNWSQCAHAVVFEIHFPR